MSSQPKTKVATVTDIGRDYYARHQTNLVYSRGSWWTWTGTVWEPVHEIAQRYEFWRLMEEFEQKDGQSPSLGKVTAVQDYVRSRLFVPEAEMDAYPSLVNLQNGIYNLEDGNLYPHNPDYRLTTILPFQYDPTAKADLWQMYLMTTFVKPRTREHDRELAEFVQEAIGYSLTTDISQHVTFWCLGEGANGKGVLFHVLEELAGTASMALNVGLLRREQYQLAMLAGKRIALCSEAGATGNLVEDALVKSLVAGDTMNVRQVYKEGFELRSTAKLWWSMNELPSVADTSEGFWRRVRVIPFNRTFSDNERILDLKDKLDLELSGIFNWAMDGLRRLRQRGHFVEPLQVQVATAQYRKESNPVALFVEEMCQAGPGLEAQSSVLYGAYRDWCLENTFRPHSSKNFKKDMERLGFMHRSGMHFKMYDGIDLLQQPWP